MAQMIIIDEIGYTPISRSQANRLFTFISDAYESASIVFTTNTDAHLRSVLVGRSETIILIDGKMDLGEFGFIYFVDLDQTRACERTMQVQIIG